MGPKPWDKETAESNNRALLRYLELADRRERLRDVMERRYRPDDRSAVVGRARAYVAKEPVAVSGQHGHGRCFHVACVLVKGFGLSEAEAVDAVGDWNARCLPPWSEGELKHKFADAAKQAGEVGYLLKPAGENGHPNGNGHAAVVSVQATGPAPAAEIDIGDVATIDDLARAGAEVRWLWHGWIPVGVLTAVAAEGGTGKTRFCADILRRIRHGLPWPDGQAMTLAEDARSLWVVADNHHDEMVTLATAFDIKESIWINAPKADPYAGVTLETPSDLAALEARIRAVRPELVIVDTVGNATDKNLGRQEDAKAFYQPLQILARKYACAILCLTHLNTGGKFLGRRVLEKVRVAIKMSRPDPDNDRRRLEVAKSNAKQPVALGVTMGDAGNDYDDKPPEPAEEGNGTPQPGGTSIGKAAKKACDWLKRRLAGGPARVSVVRTEAEMAGFSSKTLYGARGVLPIEQYESERRQWWKLTSEEDE